MFSIHPRGSACKTESALSLERCTGAADQIMPKSFVLYLPQSTNLPHLLKAIAEADYFDFGASFDEEVMQVQIRSASERVIIGLGADPRLWINEAQAWDWLDCKTRSLLNDTVVITVDFSSNELAKH